MWERAALLPLALQSFLCPSRASEAILLGLACWCCGFFCGAAVVALALSPWLRRVLARFLLVALQEPFGGYPGNGRRDRLLRYQD